MTVHTHRHPAQSRSDCGADERIPSTTRFTLGRDPQDVLSLESLFPSRDAGHDGLVTYGSKLPAVGLGIVQNEPNLLARRQLFEVVPVTL